MIVVNFLFLRLQSLKSRDFNFSLIEITKLYNFNHDHQKNERNQLILLIF